MKAIIQTHSQDIGLQTFTIKGKRLDICQLDGGGYSVIDHMPERQARGVFHNVTDIQIHGKAKPPKPTKIVAMESRPLDTKLIEELQSKLTQKDELIDQLTSDIATDALPQAMRDREMLYERITKMQELIAVQRQSTDGSDQYMRGLLNGLILAEGTMLEERPIYMDPPVNKTPTIEVPCHAPLAPQEDKAPLATPDRKRQRGRLDDIDSLAPEKD